MSTASNGEGALAVETQTTAGNYFVSNYPPFSFWKPEHLAEAGRVLDELPVPGTPLGLYMHIPFCRKRCHFCYFKVYTDKNASEINIYLKAMLRELEHYVGRTFIGGRKPRFVYFGGGTPSYLSPKQLTEFTDACKALLPWDEAEEVTFECEPGTLNEAKLRVIRDLGVTRLSLGVENFDDALLKLNGRAHESKEIRRAYDFARSIDFPQINIDLIAGMIGETPENWDLNIERTIELQPDSVTIYQMEIPFNTTIYQEMKAAGKITAPVADWNTKRAWVASAFERLERAGYTVTSAYTAVKDPARTRFIYRDSLWTGADLLSLGVSSFSHIGGAHLQNEKDFGPYLEKLDRNEPPIHRAYKMNDEERLIRQLVLQFKLGKLNRAAFLDRFGVDIKLRFADSFRRLEELGVFAWEGDQARLSRAGLLQVDFLLHHFFLPEHQHARYT